MRFTALALLCLACLGFAATAHARWLKAESPLFVIYSDGDEKQLREFTRNLHEFDAMLRLLTGTKEPAPNKLPVYLLRHQGLIREIAPQMMAGVAGFYHAGDDSTLAVALR